MNINRVVLTGNLTRDPELRSLPSGTSVCTLGVAFSDRVKVNDEWTDRSHFVNVTVWGGQGENCARFLSKGSAVAVDGRLQYRAWEGPDGSKRSAVDVVADSVQFLGARESAPDDPPVQTSTDESIPF